MAKIMIGPNADGGTYSFNKTAKTIAITLPSGNAPSKEGLLLITDAENGTIIYNFADLSKGATLSGNTYTLEYDTNIGSFNNNDALQVWYYDTTPQSVSIEDLSIALRMALSHTNKNSESSMGISRSSVVEGKLDYISTVQSISSLNAIVNPGFRVMEDILQPAMNSNWNDKVRSKLF